MVAMARALMMEPSVLFLGEPQPGSRADDADQVFERVLEFNQAGVSVVMVEQNARRCCCRSHRAYVLDRGRNAHQGTGQENHGRIGGRPLPRHPREAGLRRG